MDINKMGMMNDTYTLVTTTETNATPEQIWNAWNDPTKIAKWWGPAGFISTIEELDVRAGGIFRVVMHGPDGVNYPNVYVFDRADRPHQLIYTNQGSKQFNLAPFQSVMDLDATGDMTKITLTMRFASEQEKRKHVQQFHAEAGSRELLERLVSQALP
jgi:uncharacterized protein YndB with AHSA1/START domain